MGRPELADFSGRSLDNILAHYGVKGMRWGVRRSRTDRKAPQDVTVKTKPGGRIKTVGGKRLPASEDAKTAAVSKQKVKRSSTNALSNDELQSLVRRMNLEQQYSDLSSKQKSAGLRFMEHLITASGKQQAQRIVNDTASKQVGELLRKS